MSVADIVKERDWFSLTDLLPMAESMGGSLTGLIVMDTVAVLGLAVPSLALNVNESVPL